MDSLDPTTALRFLADSHDLFAVLGPGLELEWVNEAVAMLGYTPETAAGLTAADILTPDGLARAARSVAAVSGGTPFGGSAPFAVRTAAGGEVECDFAAWSLGDGRLAVHVRPTLDARILRDLLAMVLADAPVGEVLGHMLELLDGRADFCVAAIEYEDPATGTRHVVGSLGPAVVGRGSGTDGPVPRGPSPWTEVWARGVELVAPGLPEAVRDAAAAEGLGWPWLLPVTHGDRVGAVVTMWMDDALPRERGDFHFVDQIRPLTEMVLEWYAKTHQLSIAATRDPLTKLPNRRVLDELDAAGAVADLGAVYLDLDGFKPVNDERGHAAGDRLLVEIAGRLESTAAGWTVVRIGGDEFTVVCPGTTREALAALAEGIRAAVSTPVSLAGHDGEPTEVRVTASVGCAFVEKGHPSDVVEAADRALATAKSAGGDAVRWV